MILLPTLTWLQLYADPSYAHDLHVHGDQSYDQSLGLQVYDTFGLGNSWRTQWSSLDVQVYDQSYELEASQAALW